MTSSPLQSNTDKVSYLSGSSSSNATNPSSKEIPMYQLPPLSSPNYSPLNNNDMPFSESPSTSIPKPATRSPVPSDGYRPLNVKDALSYLDQVKLHFGNRPDVYNQFLDIMKDFKSQAIDTPGVIERVSTLFEGYPTLINGFNTFLPPGYRIHCSNNPNHEIRITTPSGTFTPGSTLPSSPSLLPSKPSSYYQPFSIPPQRPPLPTASSPANYYHPPLRLPSLPPPTPTIQHHHRSIYQYQPPSTSSPSPAQKTHPPHQLSVSPSTDQKRPAVDFNNAINYVNKIKTRFVGDPDAYKQFLEVLQTYQREERRIDEVYAHVQQLFHGHDDLLEEFEQFLPEIGHFRGNKRPLSQAMPPAGKKKRGSGRKLSKDLGDYHQQQPHHRQLSTSAFIKRGAASSNFDPANPSVSTEEVELFEQIRKHIGNKPSYEVFLKLLTLYTQGILELDQLMIQIEAFFKTKPELVDWLKYVINYAPNKISPTDLNARTMIQKPDLVHCDVIAESPSYRLVPKDWQYQPCSGRDSLCWEVLNDAYVSHPIWASEETAFMSNKKNSYEEAMHRCEEERYEYDLNIDANLSSISLLEPIMVKLETMSLEEKQAMTLPSGLGGQTVSIYERIIKKTYGGERGQEVIDLLYSSPATVVPILMKRLKQKDEEWTNSKREWNKTWREMDEKNYYKSLDYQGLTFKTSERRTMTSRFLINEIESAYQDDENAPCANKKSSAALRQFTYDMSDAALFTDISLLIFSYMDHQSGFNKTDRDRVHAFLETFVSQFFHVTNVIPTEYCHVRADDPSPSSGLNGSSSSEDRLATIQQQEEDLTPSSEDSSSESISQRQWQQQQRRRSLFARSASRIKQDTQPASSPSSSATLPLQHQARILTKPIHYFRRQHSMFANGHFYSLFRLYEMLYGRLRKMKQLSESLAKDPNAHRENQVAVNLGLRLSRFDDIDLSQGRYRALLEQIDRFFDSDVDANTFEETARHLFTTDAYILFNVDKLVHAIIKQIQTLENDEKSCRLLKLYQDQQEDQTSVYPTLSAYLGQAEDIIGADEHVFKMQLDLDKKRLCIYLMDQDEAHVLAQDHHDEYTLAYLHWADEVGDTSSGHPVVLQRTIQPASLQVNDVIVKNGAHYSIDETTYRLSCKPGTEDLIYRPSNYPSI